MSTADPLGGWADHQSAEVRLYVAWCREHRPSALHPLAEALGRTADLEDHRRALAADLEKAWTPAKAAALASAGLVRVDADRPAADLAHDARASLGGTLAWVRSLDERPADLDESAYEWATARYAPSLVPDDPDRWIVKARS